MNGLADEAAGESQEDRALTEGTLDLLGRIMPASNATYLAEATLGEEVVRCVYKPVAGERPLWDFPDHTLASREVAAHLISEALGWDIVPPTVLRDGPHGIGMVQAWREPSEEIEAVDLCPVGEVPEGYLRVLDATDGHGNEVSLVHEDSLALRRMALFDVVVNNADRKGGHVLAMSDGHRHGVDHGICFHTEDKLRTVLWGWAGEPLGAEECADLARVGDALEGDSRLHSTMHDLLTEPEVVALRRRITRLLRQGRMPAPADAWPSIPWPPF